MYAVLDQAGDTLKSHGHIVYLGEGAAGKWGIVDASECPPTFGADVFDVRGYIPDGWASFCKSCLKISDTDHDYDIGFQDFKEKILPGLSSKDLTVLTGTAPFYEKHQDLFASMDRTKVFQILIEPVSKTLKNNPSFDLIISGAKDWDEIPMFTSMMLKLVYNAITTAAHVFKGKVFQNKMIDLRISNNKLYHRAVQIIQGLIGVKESTAVDALLRSVYGTDRVASANRTAPVSSHIQATVGREGIVPVALLLATERFTIKQAMSRVEKEHIIRNIIKPVPES